ncbi:O-antigen polymerase [Clostridium gasigenes]|uniref:O-antigen polymerase n=1 Tax=Clostridium gasigenes TaxID=94869 RepID=UPI001C0E6BA8|nr:O-antigen polymerase [Clostridium gasigenes]MBU3104461.1 oligosaccharide repeat unit polymerase [Clostridium gasigenes]
MLIQRKKLHYIYYIFIALICITAYSIFYLMGQDNYNIQGLIIFILSLLSMICGIESMRKFGFKANNLFQIVYFFCLMLNTFNISALQKPKTIIDIYYFFTGAYIMVFFLYIGEKGYLSTKYKINIPKIFNSNNIIIGLLIVYYTGYIYKFSQTGIKLFSNTALRYLDDSIYVIPGVSGMLNLICWILLMYLPNTNKINKAIIIPSIIIMSGILDFSRGNVMRICIFLLVDYILRKGKNILNKKYIKKVLIISTIIIMVFVGLGELRQKDSSNVFSISNILYSKVNNEYFNWIYSYSAINFDVLKLTIDSNSFGYPTALLIPIIRIVSGSDTIISYYEVFAERALNGFNASTFLSPFVADGSLLYIIEIIIFAILIGFIIGFTKKYNLRGVYIFIMTMLVLTVFGNYILNPNYLFSMVVAIILLIFSSNNNKE